MCAGGLQLVLCTCVGVAVEWCQRVGVRHPACTIRQLPLTGRGVVAVRDIAAGEVVVEVPDSKVLMAENCSIARQLEAAGLVKGVAEGPMMEVQGLVLAVMAEVAAGRSSHWAAYLDFIPRWGATAGVGGGQKPWVQSAGAEQVEVLWREVALPFIRAHPKLRLPRGAAGRRAYRWATAAVASYSFILGDDRYQAMVPFWDALNHVTGAVNGQVQGQGQGQGQGQPLSLDRIALAPTPQSVAVTVLR
ncbi:hypothetical protein QJQ45_028299 [Haematococcus lacustris]|nr:hypothetical protein QJQ45_028299 [Haematococcus lacustris]